MVDVRKWEKLNKLYLNHNIIKRYNKEAIWNHKELINLHLSNNNMLFPEGEIYLPSLNYVHLGDNNMSINIQFDTDSFPNLIDLYLNGNDLIHFPDKSLKHTLQYLGFARCNLNSIPSYLSGFSNLLYLYARDNNITKVDDDLKNLRYGFQIFLKILKNRNAIFQISRLRASGYY